MKIIIITVVGAVIATFAGSAAQPTHVTDDKRPPQVDMVAPIENVNIQPIEEAKPIDLPWEVKGDIAGTPPKWINEALAVYKGQGLSKEGAAYIVGNFLQEKRSAFHTGDPCGGTLGDSGLAHGFGQWHPGRRADMPCGFTEQLVWALNTEMPRDAKNNGYGCLCDALRGNDVGLIAKRIKNWERYGHEGERFTYGANVLSAIQ